MLRWTNSGLNILSTVFCVIRMRDKERNLCPQTRKLTPNIRTEGLSLGTSSQENEVKTDRVHSMSRHRERELKTTLAVNSQGPSSAT